MREGKIIKKINDSIQVEFNEPDKPIEWILFDYKGIPSNILNIQKIKPKKTDNVYVDSKVQLNSITPENSEDVYYYSIEQQVAELLETMTQNIDTTDNKIIHKINKIISRYIEINSKYYNFDNNYVFTPL